MFIVDRKKDGVKILELNGRVDAVADHFVEDLLQMVQNELKILVDCSNLNYINSSGLRAFLTVVKNVGKFNGRFVICNLPENIKEIFKISGFLQVFEVYDTYEDAFNSFVS